MLAPSVLGAPAVSQWGNPLGYTGRPLSAVSGLYDLRARHERLWDALITGITLAAPSPISLAGPGQ